MNIAKLRSLSSIIASRASLAEWAGRTFGGKRDIYETLGYKRVLTFADFQQRYERGGIAATIIETFPEVTWRGRGELIEDDTTVEATPFEEAWYEIEFRHNLWAMLKRADIVAGIGRYSVMVLGADGAPASPLPKGDGPESLKFVRVFNQDQATIEEWDTNTNSDRFGWPQYYRIKQASDGIATIDEKVHWTRVIHISDTGEVFAPPRLAKPWNDLDNLTKVVGGGSEAFWIRAHQGFQMDVDPERDLDDDAEKALDEEAVACSHGIRRMMRTRGVKMKALGSDVADFKPPMEAIMAQISATTKIPQRILMGSERGQLASEQDQGNFSDRVFDRQTELADPFIVRQLADRLIEYSYLPEPKEYEVRWPVAERSPAQKVDLANRMADANQKNSLAGGPVFLVNEIRDIAMGMPARDDADLEAQTPEPVLPEPVPGAEPAPQPLAAASRRKVTGTAMDKRRHWWKTRVKAGKKPYVGPKNVRRIDADVA